MRRRPILGAVAGLFLAIAPAATAADLPFRITLGSRGNNSTMERFRDMDRNNDGVVTRREWSGGGRAFNVLDRNNDGVIERYEYRNAYRLDSYDNDVVTVVVRDRNDDGYISRHEFTGSDRAFDDLDLDNDGRLDRWEIRSVR